MIAVLSYAVLLSVPALFAWWAVDSLVGEPRRRGDAE